MAVRFKSGLLILVVVAWFWTPVARGQTPEQAPTANPDQQSAGVPSPENQKLPSAGGEEARQRLSGSVSGTVADQSGAVVAGARVKLAGGDQTIPQARGQEVVAGPDGQFFFPNVAPGTFQLTVTAAGFAEQTFSGIVHEGEISSLSAGPIALTVADEHTEVDVSMTQVEVAEEQIKVEEKQRVLGFLPNFYVSYVPDAAPLTAKQKFKLAWRTMVDPFTVGIAAAVAGIEQGQNHFAEYGPGAQGYGKRFGASYADATTGTLIGAALLPALLKQDPRYFYKGTGSTTSRALYAIANSVICKGDNRHWQVNYSNILGNLAAAAYLISTIPSKIGTARD